MTDLLFRVPWVLREIRLRPRTRPSAEKSSLGRVGICRERETRPRSFMLRLNEERGDISVVNW